MPPWKKGLIITFSIFAGFGILVLGLWIFYSNATWGFARKISPDEAEKRLSLIQSAESWVGCSEADGTHEPIIDLYNSQEVLPMDYEVLYADSWCNFCHRCCHEGRTDRHYPAGVRVSAADQPFSGAGTLAGTGHLHSPPR